MEENLRGRYTDRPQTLTHQCLSLFGWPKHHEAITPTTGHSNPLGILQQPSSLQSLGLWVISMSKEPCVDIRDIWCQPLPGLLTLTLSSHPTPILYRASSIPYLPIILSEPPYANESSLLPHLSRVHSGTANYKPTPLQYCVFEETPFLSTCFKHLHLQI